jgi:hypothetical protein
MTNGTTFDVLQEKQQNGINNKDNVKKKDVCLSIGDFGNKFGVEEEEYFFEGAEKLLEIWFSAPDGDSCCSLRQIPHEQLVAMLDLARCKILHWRSNEQMDSYLLRPVLPLNLLS